MLAMDLKFDLLLSSPYVRAAKTAQIVASELDDEVTFTEFLEPGGNPLGLISQIKARSDPRTSKAVLIVHGGALERARALDLGDDDVVSFPFEPSEFAAKIRTQFREMQPELELEAKLVEALGGRIKLEDQLGGAQFTFTLPKKRGTDQRPLAA